MDKKGSLSRRNFIKAAGVAGGAALIAGTVTVGESRAAAPQGRTEPDPLLKGVSDIHIHAFPDTRPRSINELDFTRQAKEAGYRSVMFKSNDFACHDRAYLIRQAVPDFECFGSMCMNRCHGDRVNPAAAEKAVQTEGRFCRCIWMPTLDAEYQHKHEKRPGKGIPVLGDNGQVLPEVVRVMEICAEEDIMFASGHSSPAETLVMAQKAREVGVKKFVVTHANSLIWKMTDDQIQKAADLGAWIEFCYLPCLWGPGTAMPNMKRDSDVEFVRYVSVAPERSFITTDLGQRNMPNPLDGMRACIQAMLDGGVSSANIDAMLRATPGMLVGLKQA